MAQEQAPHGVTRGDPETLLAQEGRERVLAHSGTSSLGFSKRRAAF